MKYYNNLYKITNYNQILKYEQKVRTSTDKLIKDANELKTNVQTLEEKLSFIEKCAKPEHENWDPLKFRHTSTYYANQRYRAMKDGEAYKK